MVGPSGTRIITLTAYHKAIMRKISLYPLSFHCIVVPLEWLGTDERHHMLVSSALSAHPLRIKPLNLKTGTKYSGSTTIADFVRGHPGQINTYLLLAF